MFTSNVFMGAIRGPPSIVIAQQTYMYMYVIKMPSTLGKKGRIT